MLNALQIPIEKITGSNIQPFLFCLLNGMVRDTLFLYTAFTCFALLNNILIVQNLSIYVDSPYNKNYCLRHQFFSNDTPNDSPSRFSNKHRRWGRLFHASSNELNLSKLDVCGLNKIPNEIGCVCNSVLRWKPRSPLSTIIFHFIVTALGFYLVRNKSDEYTWSFILKTKN